MTLSIPSKLLATIALFATPLASHAERQTEELRVSCGGIFGLCGFVDSDNDVVIPQLFEKLYRFSDQRAPVKVDGLWGYLDTDGTFAIEPIFDRVGAFRGQRAGVIYKGNAGIIDVRGEFVVPAEFWSAIPFGQDAALVSRLQDLPEDANEPLRWLNSDRSSEKFHIFNSDIGIVTNFPMNFKWFVQPGDIGPTDRIWASLDGRTFGLMDNAGNWLTEPLYENVRTLHDDRAIVTTVSASNETLWGAVDGEGTIAIALENRQLDFFSNGYGLVYELGSNDQRQTGLIAPDGALLGDRLFEQARRPTASSPARVMENGIWYNFADDGSLFREEPDGTIIASCPQGLTIVREGTGYEVINQVGERQVQERLDFIDFGIAKNGLISGGSILRREIDCSGPITVGLLRPSGERDWTFVRTDGRPLIPERWFSITHPFIAGYAIVRTGSVVESSEMWGILNELGEFTLPLGPTRISHGSGILLSNGQPYFLFGAESDQYLADAYGQLVTPPEIELIDDNRRRYATRCSGGARIVGRDGSFGIEGPDGETLVPAVHRAISCYRNGVAWGPNEDTKQWCPIGTEGVFSSEPACIERYYPYSSSNYYPEQFSDDRFESNILWVRAWLEWGLDLRVEPPLWVGEGIMSGTYRSFPEP